MYPSGFIRDRAASDTIACARDVCLCTFAGSLGGWWCNHPKREQQTALSKDQQTQPNTVAVTVNYQPRG